MKTIVRLLFIGVLALALPSCSFLQTLGRASTAATGTTTPAIAQDVAYEMESAYGVALGSANIYGRLPDCSATQGNPCRLLSTMLQIEKARGVARTAINDLKTAASSISPTASQLDTAISLAKAAMNAYQSAVPATK